MSKDGDKATSLAAVVAAIHDSPVKCSLAVTGAGGTAVTALLAVPGCSRTLVTAEVPYAQDATRAFIDDSPSKFLHMPLAVQLAQHAHAKTRALLGAPPPTIADCDAISAAASAAGGNTAAAATVAAPVPSEDVIYVGVGCTAAVRTDRSRRGEDGAYIAVWSDRGCHHAAVATYHLLLDKALSRAEQEERISASILFALATVAAVPSAERMLLAPLNMAFKDETCVEDGPSFEEADNPADAADPAAGAASAAATKKEQSGAEEDETNVLRLVSRMPVPAAVVANPLMCLSLSAQSTVTMNTFGVPRVARGPAPFTPEEFAPLGDVRRVLFTSLWAKTPEESASLRVPSHAAIAAKLGGNDAPVARFVVTRHQIVHATAGYGRPQREHHPRFPGERVAFTTADNATLGALSDVFRNHTLVVLLQARDPREQMNEAGAAGQHMSGEERNVVLNNGCSIYFMPQAF